MDSAGAGRKKRRMWRKKSYPKILQTAHYAAVTPSYLPTQTSSVAEIEVACLCMHI